jgi:hypothetical protein
MLRAAFGASMRVGYHSPKTSRHKQLLLLRLMVLCILGWLEFAPASAWALPAIPMCSIFGECIEAPPPGSPPTAGEIRTASQNPFEQAPILQRAPLRDSTPQLLSVPTLEPARLAESRAMFPSILTTDLPGLRAAQLPRYRDKGVQREVFRPPCHAA